MEPDDESSKRPGSACRSDRAKRVRKNLVDASEHIDANQVNFENEESFESSDTSSSITTRSECPPFRLDIIDLVPNARVKLTKHSWLNRFLNIDMDDYRGPISTTSSVLREESEYERTLFDDLDLILLQLSHGGLKPNDRLLVQWTLLPEDSADEAVTDVMWGATLLGPAPGGLRDIKGRRVFLIEYDEGTEEDEPASIMKVIFLSQSLIVHTDLEDFAAHWELSEDEPDPLSALRVLINSCKTKNNGKQSALCCPAGEELLVNLWVSLVAKPEVLEKTTRRVCDILPTLGLDAAQQRSMAGEIGRFVTRVREALVACAIRVNDEGRASIR
eukprot:GHVL01010335.1.p1 GENE.GHVL01010335.1~~GHVL01010335.1.p1  ORF type:complete len:331 (+),score=44.96 GHVL01010335.1:110-1102(+)